MYMNVYIHVFICTVPPATVKTLLFLDTSFLIV